MLHVRRRAATILALVLAFLPLGNAPARAA